MKYCNNCILPDTRPHIVIDEAGVCNACKTSTTVKEIDWDEREAKFRSLVQNIKKTSNRYDCLIPVSGGKDSTWQVVVCLEYGLKPLAVTWRSPGRNALGQKNLDNLIRVGVDHIDFSIDPRTERIFTLAAFKKYGSTAIPMHMAIFNVPLLVAARFHIPLIIWGENSAFEYGGNEEEVKGYELNREWVKKFGVTHGTTAADWISEELSERDLAPYFGPTDEELAQARTRGIFLGYYFQWDVEKSFAVAKKHGFESSREGPKTGLYDYADIDDDFIAIHHYFKWYKFGFTRLFDNLSLEIRRGRMTRDRAIAVLKDAGDQRPDRDIELLCQFLKISSSTFWEIGETFRNKAIWYQDNGRWKIKDFLIPDWKWR